MPSHPRRKYPPVHDNKRDAAMSGRPRLVGTPLTVEEEVSLATDRVFEAVRLLGRHPSDGCLLLAAVCRQRELDGLLDAIQRRAQAERTAAANHQRMAAVALARRAKAVKNRIRTESRLPADLRSPGQPEAAPLTLDSPLNLRAHS